MTIPIIIAVVVILDQITKVLVRTYMTEGQSISIIDGFFSLTYINNEGVAFSFLSGHRGLVTAVQIICTGLIILLLVNAKGQNRIFDIALALIIGGGIGNIIDRVIFGKVTDMLSFSIFPPIFNVADIAVTVGCFLLIIYVIMDSIKGHEVKGSPRDIK